jgi:apolipoprotein N-acyltransferase
MGEEHNPYQRLARLLCPTYIPLRVPPLHFSLPPAMPALSDCLSTALAALRSRPLALSALSGALLALAFPCHPQHLLAWLYHPLWAHLALVPLLLALHGRSFKSGFKAGWTTGFVWNLLSLYWVAYTQGGGLAVVGGTLLLAIYLGLYVGLFAGVQDALRLRFGVNALLLAPVLWAAQEYLLSLGELGFPWLLLGHGQAALPHFIQHAVWTGVYGVSFWVVLLNVLFGLGLVQRRWHFLGLAALCYLLPWLHARSAFDAMPAQHMRIGVIQPNVTLEQKWGPGGLEKSFAALESLSRQAADDAPALLVWPETALPCYLSRRPDCRNRAFALVEALDLPLLTGASDYDFERREPYNAAFYLEPGAEHMPSYAKMHLVPFGERTPYRDSIPLLRNIDWTQLTGDLGPAEFARGTERTVFPHPDHPFAVLICFESVFPDLVRRHVQAGAEILINITNDSWFGSTAGPYQHALINAMRAVENRISIARAATSGISLFIDPFGRIYQTTDLFVAAAPVADLPVGLNNTFYTRHGDLFAKFCLLLAAFGLAVPFTPFFRKPA